MSARKLRRPPRERDAEDLMLKISLKMLSLPDLFLRVYRAGRKRFNVVHYQKDFVAFKNLKNENLWSSIRAKNFMNKMDCL